MYTCLPKTYRENKKKKIIGLEIHISTSGNHDASLNFIFNNRCFWHDNVGDLTDSMKSQLELSKQEKSNGSKETSFLSRNLYWNVFTS